MRMRFLTLILIVNCLILYPEFGDAQNLTIFKSEASVEVTADQLESVMDSLGLAIFDKVVHDEIVRARGVQIAPTQSLLFEDPDLTAQIIQCQQTTALDLPMEILVWEENGDVYIGFIDPKFMKKRFLIMGCDETLEAMSRLMIRIVNDALRAQ